MSIPRASIRGTGRQAVRAGRASSIREGFQLWAFQQNTGARRFYERHGCALVRLTDGADNEEKLPDALYVWPAKDGADRMN